MSLSVLVTGGAGYVGSHACKALAQAGYTPVVYDDVLRGHEWAVRWGPLERGDVADSERLTAVIVRYRPVAVLHFAALAYVGESVEQPERYYRNNVAGSIALLAAMRTQGIRHIVFSSTCSTYGIPEKTPIAEDHPQAPVNPYGAGKLMVECILRDCDSAYGMRHVSLRYFNAAGADPGGEIGEVHDPETHLIPLALMTAAGLRPSITVFGDDYHTADGTCVRDYVHVADLADAHVSALRYLMKGGHSCSLNLGTGQGASVREVIAATRRVTGRAVPEETGARRPGDPPILVASAQLARSVLGWTPRYPDLDSQVGHAWRWLQSALSKGYLCNSATREVRSA